MNARACWNDLSSLPDNHSGDWVIHGDGTTRPATREEALRCSEKWLPANALLFGAPGIPKLLPPVLIGDLEQASLRSVRNYCRNVSIGFAAFGVTICLMAIGTPSAGAFSLGVLALVMSGIVIGDYSIGLKTSAAIAERAMFFRWLRVSKEARRACWIWLFAIGVVGMGQVVLAHRLGSNDAVFRRYGAMYSAVQAGEYWRLMVGPFLHYSVTHYVNNAVILIVVGVLCRALLGWKTVWVFLAGNAAGAYVQMVLGGSLYDNYAGVSAGIYSLYGVLVAAGAVDRHLLPKGVLVLIVNLALLGIIASELLSVNAATVAHVSGLFLGILAGWGLVGGRDGS